jgi:multiple sugar transport system permease protein
MYKLKKFLANTSFHTIMTVILVVYMIPIMWILSTSFKTDKNLLDPKQILPNPVTLSHYVKLFELVPDFWQITLNTLTVAVLCTVGQLLSCSLAGYALARFHFPGRNIIFFALLVTLMVPGHVTLIPVYVMFRELHLINTLQAMFIPAFFGNAFATFFFRQFFKGIPKELEEAAYIDGASRLRTFRSVILPISLPPFLSLGLLSFVGAWNGFFIPTIYLQTREVWVLTQGLRSLIGRDNARWGEILAGVVMVSLPIVIIYFIVQKYFTEGIAFTGLKG